MPLCEGAFGLCFSNANVALGSIEMYDHPGQAEPYLPPVAGELLDLATEVCNQGHALTNKLSETLRETRYLETLQSNSQHSNLLEDETSHEYLKAHVQAELGLDKVGTVAASALGVEALRSMHQELYTHVIGTVVQPGVWRTQNVQVQRHIAPAWESLPRFFERTDQVYLQPWRSSAELLIATAAAHHRLLWLHPFRDGNGRSMRLQSQLALRPFGSKFWSLSAGLWRRRDEYFNQLAAADSHRCGDLDGRGNLSQKHLVEWCLFFVSVCGDEIRTAERWADSARLAEKIFAPENAHLFTKEAAMKAFAHIKPK